MEQRNSPLAWAGVFAQVMNLIGSVRRYRNPYALGPTPKRASRHAGRSRWEGHRIRKAKRLAPSIAKVQG